MNELAPAWEALRAGHVAEALAAARRLLDAAPAQADAWMLLAAGLRAEARPHEAEACLQHACALAPQRGDIALQLGQLLRSRGRTEAALAAFRRAHALLQTVPDAAALQAAAALALTEALIAAGTPDPAVALAEAELARHPQALELRQALGNAHYTRGDFRAALAAYDQALAQLPEHPPLLYNAALAHERLGERAAAVARLRRLLARDATHVNAHIKLGDLLKDLGEAAAAADAYRGAIALAPQLAEVHNNLGAALARLGRWPEAIAAYRAAQQHGLTDPVLWMNLGNAHQALRELDAALAAYREGLARAPEHLTLLLEATHVQQKLCDWQGFDTLRARLLAPLLGFDGPGTPPSPFAFLALPFATSADEQATVARRYARHLAQAVPQPLAPRRMDGGRRLRVGYVSADFHNHATAHLMRGLFRRHDRSRLEVFAYSYGPDDGSDYRRGIVADCDRFIDIATLSDRAAAEHMRADEIDVLVDLKGYTGSARPLIFAWRPAPVQAQWLGYPGTLGADWIDYIVADRTVLPETELSAYSEVPVWLPASYQVNDGAQAIAPTPTRAECGLPEHGVVFCCFNSPYKIEPRVFAIWLRLLRALPGSVLWLYAGNPTACDALRAHAAAAGVDPQRLVFAPALPKPQHLARHRHADLFLDTPYYNAHTTASDALWAGVPVLSVPGSSFAARVAASLLRALGLTELVCPNLAAYEHAALSLAREPARLAALRARLAAARDSAPLFDTDAFARALDRAYLAMRERHLAGLGPAPLSIEPQ